MSTRFEGRCRMTEACWHQHPHADVSTQTPATTWVESRSLLVIMVFFPEVLEASWYRFSIFQYFSEFQLFSIIIFSICKSGVVWVFWLHGSPSIGAELSVGRMFSCRFVDLLCFWIFWVWDFQSTMGGCFIEIFIQVLTLLLVCGIFFLVVVESDLVDWFFFIFFVIVWLSCVWYAEEKCTDKAEDSVVMGWLWRSMELHIATAIEFVILLKGFGNLLQKLFCIRVMFSRVYEMYEKIFTTGQSGRALSIIFLSKFKFLSSLRGILEYRIIFHIRFDIFSLLSIYHRCVIVMKF